MFLPASYSQAQVDPNQTGAWYMYFWNTTIKDSEWGAQGDIQYRNWDIVGDLEQLMLRGGITFKPRNSSVKFTLGYGNITSGTFGSSSNNVIEHRIYQEALISNIIAKRFLAKHRFRFEQRNVPNQDFRTRYRYALFLNVPLNNETLISKTIYLALYDELFINAQKNVGNGRSVELFDRNRLYGGVGYVLQDGLNIQLGYMAQALNTFTKNQLQVSLHHKIK